MTDTQQPEALRLADRIKSSGQFTNLGELDAAAAELYCLHAENVALQQCYDAARLEIDHLRGAIAKWGAPPQISESDTDYWVRNRALILRAIEERGFRLVSSGGLFWLHGPSHPAQAGAVPLTDGQVESLLYKYGYDPDDEHMAAMLKEANGIKGGPHGTE